jgi:hypothetical protein
LYSNNQNRIQTVIFKFKRTNQEATPHYCPLAPTVGSSAGGSARPGFNTRVAARSGQAIGMQPARPAISVHRGGSTGGAGAPGAGATAPHWNQPKTGSTPCYNRTLISCWNFGCSTCPFVAVGYLRGAKFRIESQVSVCKDDI